MEGGSLARVAFEGYSVQLVGAFGWRPLQELFKVGRAAELQLLRCIESRSCIPGRCSSRALPQLLPQLAALPAARAAAEDTAARVCSEADGRVYNYLPIPAAARCPRQHRKCVCV